MPSTYLKVADLDRGARLPETNAKRRSPDCDRWGSMCSPHVTCAEGWLNIEDNLVGRQFGHFAERYAASPSQAKGRSLERILCLTQPQRTDRVLDVATGAGFTAVKLARCAACVIAVDTTAEMLERARHLAAQIDLSNITFGRADAHALPFLDHTFDLVTCRIALHHFTDARQGVREMARVCRPGGRIALADSVVPEDPDVGLWINRFETRRDPSHHRSFALSELVRIFTDEGLNIAAVETAPALTVFHEWTWRMGVSSEVEKELERDLRGADAAVRRVINPRVENGELVFQLMEGILVCRKAN